MAILFHKMRGFGNGAIAVVVLAGLAISVFTWAPTASATDLEVRFEKSARSALSKDDREEIEQIAKDAYREASSLLSGLQSRIRMTIRMGSDVIPETGEGGAAISPSEIRWTLDAARASEAGEIARTYLRSTIFHELHHLARGWTLEGNVAPIRIIDAAVAEGLATAFARQHSDAPMPWADYPQDADDWIAEIAALPAGASYADWMFWHPDGRRWVGYRAGTLIAERAIVASGKSAAELASVPSDEVVRLSGTLR